MAFNKIVWWSKLKDNGDYEIELAENICKEKNIKLIIVESIDDFMSHINSDSFMILSVLHADEYLDEIEFYLKKYKNQTFYTHWGMDENIYTFKQTKLLGHPNVVKPEDYSVLLRLAQEFDQSPACWINPNGEIIDTHGSHTNTALEMPETFGLSKNEANLLFAKGEENAVLIKIIQNGWIRIRNQRGVYFASISYLSENNKNNLKQWANSILKLHSDRSDAIIILDQLEPKTTCRVLLKNISIGNFTHDPSLAVSLSIKEDYNLWSLLK